MNVRSLDSVLVPGFSASTVSCTYSISSGLYPTHARLRDDNKLIYLKKSGIEVAHDPHFTGLQTPLPRCKLLLHPLPPFEENMIHG